MLDRIAVYSREEAKGTETAMSNKLLVWCCRHLWALDVGMEPPQQWSSPL